MTVSRDQVDVGAARAFKPRQLRLNMKQSLSSYFAAPLQSRRGASPKFRSRDAVFHIDRY